ncbi:MAG: WD40 repeat domain-containing protein [Anaerolineae bacterium]|nr:WD40 repeat domain-containing protein [Anaerolineae bacterium]
MAFGPHGQQVAFASSNGGPTSIVDITSGEDVITLHGHTGQLEFAKFNAAGTRLVTIGRDSSVHVWDTEKGQSLLRLGLDTAAAQPSATFAADDDRLITSLGDEGLQVWSLPPLGEQLTVQAEADCYCDFAYSPDGDLIALPDQESLSMRLLDAVSGRPVMTLTSEIISPALAPALGHLYHPVFSSDGTRLATIIDDTDVVIWDVTTGRETLSLSPDAGVLYRIAFSPDGTRLATIGYDGSARLWELNSGAAVYALTDVYTETLTVGSHGLDIAFSPDGAKLATAGGTSVKVWDAATGNELVTLRAPQYAYELAYSPAGGELAVGVRFGVGSGVWDATSGELLLELTGHTASVTNIAYSHDGRQIATASNDGTIRLWDAESGTPRMVLQDQGVAIHLAFSPDDTGLAAQFDDHTLRVYALSLDSLVDIALARLSRWFMREECRQYLHSDTCPRDVRPAPSQLP